MIVKTARVTIDWGGGATDYSDSVIMADIQSPASAADDRTLGLPHATDSVVGAESIVLRMKWSDALLDDLDGNTETEGDLVITPVSGSGTYTATVIFAKTPAAVQLQAGNRAEFDLVLAVTDAIDWAPAA